MSASELSVKLNGDWRQTWALRELPTHCRWIGTVTRDGVTGALLCYDSGVFMMGQSGTLSRLPQKLIRTLLSEQGWSFEVAQEAELAVWVSKSQVNK